MLTGTEQLEIQRIAELEVRRYFDHYLEVVFPAQMQQMVGAHNMNETSHGGVILRVRRTFWLLIGASVMGGLGAGFGVERLVKLLVAF